MNYIDRPEFSEGQLLSAADLQLAVDYSREELEAHCLVAHTSGVVDGMTLVVPPGSASATTVAYVTAGLAVDNQGRLLALAVPLPIVPDPLSGQPSGPYPAYIWYTEAALTPSVSPLNPCSTSTNDRVRETPAVGVFLTGTSAVAQFPDAVCLGYLGWDGTSFQTYAGSAPNVRQGGGVRAHEIVAPEHAVLAHAEDTASTTFSVKGTIEAIASGDGTPPVLGVPGGTLVFSAGTLMPAPSTSTVSLSYISPVPSINPGTAPSPTGNGLLIDLGNNDQNSAVVVQSQAKTVLATVDGNGTVAAKGGVFDTMTASASIAVTTGTSTLTLGPTPPTNTIAGVTASDTLALAFGTASGDEVQFIAGAAPVASIDGTGTVTANGGSFGPVTATSVVVTTGTGASTLTLGSTPPENIAGVTASDTLALAFGTASGDELQVIAGATPVATIDAGALTMTAKNLKVGVLDSIGAAGVERTGGDLEIRTGAAGGDLLLNPGTNAVPWFRLTSSGRLMNQTVDVTPFTASGGQGTTLQLGSFAVVFGTVAVLFDNPLSQPPMTINFPVKFASPPAFFVAVCSQNESPPVTTIAAVATAVTQTTASCCITQLAPIPPNDGDSATWSNAELSSTVSWVAFGMVA